MLVASTRHSKQARLPCQPDCLVSLTALSAWLPCQPDCLVSLTVLSAWLPCQPDCLVSLTTLSAWQPDCLVSLTASSAWLPCQPDCLVSLQPDCLVSLQPDCLVSLSALSASLPWWPAYFPATRACFSSVFFLLQTLTVPNRQTMQAVCAINQSFFLRCLWYKLVQGTFTKAEGSVQLTSLYYLIWISSFLY